MCVFSGVCVCSVALGVEAGDGASKDSTVYYFILDMFSVMTVKWVGLFGCLSLFWYCM